MYKLFTDLNDGSNHVFYENNVVPHLWLLATDGQDKCSIDQFCENMMDIASHVADDLFSDEVASLISELKIKGVNTIQISGPKVKGDLQQLQDLATNFDYQAIFGTQVNKVEFYSTSDSKQYFKQYQKTHRAQYRTVTSILIIINVVVFILNKAGVNSQYQYIIPVLRPLLSFGGIVSIIFAGFTHFSLIHILFNMSFLQSMGPTLESMLGKGKFIALYFISMIFSGVIVYLFSAPNVMTAGASGALYGLFAFYVCYVLKHGRNKQHQQAILTSFAINIVITLSYSGISIAGHVGGAIIGALFFVVTDAMENIKTR